MLQRQCNNLRFRPSLAQAKKDARRRSPCQTLGPTSKLPALTVTLPSFLLPSTAFEQQAHTKLSPTDALLINTTFFASLEREESEFATFRIVYHPKGATGLGKLREKVDIAGGTGTTSAWYLLQLHLDSEVSAFTVGNVSKMASMTKQPRTAIVVGEDKGELHIQGIARRVDRHEYYTADDDEEVVVYTCRKPGQVIVSRQGETRFWYDCGAILTWTNARDLWNLLHLEESIVKHALLAICTKSANKRPRPFLEQNRYYLIGRALRLIIETMREARHGGLLAVAPARHRRKILSNGKSKYAITEESQSILKKFIDATARHDVAERERWFETKPIDDEKLLDRAIDDAYGQIAVRALDDISRNIGMLTTVDNALVLGPDLEVLCAGYHVPNRRQLVEVLEATTLAGTTRTKPFALNRYGARHRAAASFANSFAGSVVFILSEDGDLRCLHRPNDRKEVLLWNLLEPIDL